MKRHLARLAVAVLLLAVLFTTACQREVVTDPPATAATPVPITMPTASPMPKILRSRADGFYWTSHTIQTDDLRICFEMPNSDGLTSVYVCDADGGNATLLSDQCYINLDSIMYLVGDMLYFNYRPGDATTHNIKTCRINIRFGGSPERLDATIICATENYFYFYEGEDYDHTKDNGQYVPLYRADANFENKTKIPSINARRPWASADKLFVVDGKAYIEECSVLIYDENGDLLHRLDPDHTKQAEGIEYQGLYWFQDLGTDDGRSGDGYIRRYDLEKGIYLPDLEITLPVEWLMGNVIKIEDDMIYVSPVFSYTTRWEYPPIYKISIHGGPAILVPVDFDG